MLQLIWGLIAALLVYGAWQFLRALRQATLPDAEKGPDAGLDDDLLNYPAAMPKEPEHGSTVAVYSHGQPELTASAEVKNAPFDSFAIELELQRLRLEIGGLREAFEIQQKEIDFLRTNLERSVTSARPESPPISFVTAGPDVSPEYDEALALARRGVMADVIAARCGITRAEADLVASLASRGSRREAVS
jgi:hypothetical protein